MEPEYLLADFEKPPEIESMLKPKSTQVLR